MSILESPSLSTLTHLPHGQGSMIALVSYRLDLKSYWKTEPWGMWLSFCLKGQRRAQSGSVGTAKQGDTVGACKHLACRQDCCLVLRPYSCMLLLQFACLPLGQVGKPWAGCYGNWWVLLAEGEGRFLELTQNLQGAVLFFFLFCFFCFFLLPLASLPAVFGFDWELVSWGLVVLTRKTCRGGVQSVGQQLASQASLSPH